MSCVVVDLAVLRSIGEVQTVKRPGYESSLRHKLQAASSSSSSVSRMPSLRPAGPVPATTLPRTPAMSTVRPARMNTRTRVTSRTKGKVRYDRLPTGEVVASIVRDAVTFSAPDAAARPSTSVSDTEPRRGRSAVDHGSGGDGAMVLPEDYPVTRWNVTTVVEEAHRATQSMRILLTSMKEELRRAGGVVNEAGVQWSQTQLNLRRNIAQRLAVAYQSYRKSIHDIENVRFRDGNPGSGNSGSSSRSTSDASSNNSVMQRAQGFPTGQQRRVVSSISNDSDKVIDLTL